MALQSHVAESRLRVRGGWPTSHLVEPVGVGGWEGLSFPARLTWSGLQRGATLAGRLELRGFVSSERKGALGGGGCPCGHITGGHGASLGHAVKQHSV